MTKKFSDVAKYEDQTGEFRDEMAKSRFTQTKTLSQFDFEESLKSQAILGTAIEQIKSKLAAASGVLRIPLMRQLGNFEAALSRTQRIYKAERKSQ